jgi:hypothetical protein
MIVKPLLLGTMQLGLLLISIVSFGGEGNDFAVADAISDLSPLAIGETESRMLKATKTSATKSSKGSKSKAKSPKSKPSKSTKSSKKAKKTKDETVVYNAFVVLDTELSAIGVARRLRTETLSTVRAGVDDPGAVSVVATAESADRRRLQVSCPTGKFCYFGVIIITVPFGVAIAAAALLQAAADSGAFTDGLVAKGLDLFLQFFTLSGDVELVFTAEPSDVPTMALTSYPTMAPTKYPTMAPTSYPTIAPTSYPTIAPTMAPTRSPTMAPTRSPTSSPTRTPTNSPTAIPTNVPSTGPSISQKPSAGPTSIIGFPSF